MGTHLETEQNLDNVSHQNTEQSPLNALDLLRNLRGGNSPCPSPKEALPSLPTLLLNDRPIFPGDESTPSHGRNTGLPLPGENTPGKESKPIDRGGDGQHELRPGLLPPVHHDPEFRPICSNENVIHNQSVIGRPPEESKQDARDHAGDNRRYADDKINNLAQRAVDEILKDGTMHTLAMLISAGGGKDLVDEVNKSLEKAGSPLRVKLTETRVIVCGPGKGAGDYPNVFLDLIGKDGKVIQSSNPINPFKYGR